MFQNILARLKGMFAKMGLIKEINNVSQLAAVQESERQYNRIEIWKSLYHGRLAQLYDSPFHETKWMSVDGTHHKRWRATMGMPKVVAQEMAKLVFNEKCVINISVSGNDSIEEQLNEILENSHFHKLFQGKLEAMFAMGGLVIKPYYKDGSIHFSFVTADCFLPVQSTNDHIEAGVFLNVTRKGKKFYTLLEWHTWDGPTYVITNELYESDTEGSLGHKVSLSILYPDIEPETRIENLTHPLFVYIKPNLANNFDLDSPLGISIYANAIDTLKSLDVAFDSFQREFILGKKRIMVPQQALRTVVDPATGQMVRYFDVEDEVFKAYADTDNEDKIQDISVELRVQEHIDAINALLNILASQLGFSAGTFAFTGGASVATATQVISENSQTFRTKNSHETVIEAGLKELVHVLVEMMVLYGELSSIPDEIDVTVDFDDSIAEDRIQNANFYMTLVAAELMPKVEAIRRIFDLTEEQAQEWLDRIQQENTQQVPQMMESFLSTAETSIRNVNRTGR
ncbi:phage portal protein [Heyndrickxia coagulans]|uniref:Portal protein n=1 Tax=Heyndrickxia coagulans TaxID=1398 RepID=A0A150KIS1_HEYCO|nr:phage portal protein [Heyndrickxia coagulans]KYC72301.1 hypothetical protein B4099_3663 [Heyndrickxia coagulans]